MNLTIKASTAFEFLELLLEHNSNEVLWNKYLFAKLSTDSTGQVCVTKAQTFNDAQDFWNFKRNFNFPYLSICSLHNDLIIDVRTDDEYISACTDQARSVLFYEDYTDFVFLKHKPTRLHEKMLEQMGFNYVLVSNS
jgi:hypothetical protein